MNGPRTNSNTQEPCGDSVVTFVCVRVFLLWEVTSDRQNETCTFLGKEGRGGSQPRKEAGASDHKTRNAFDRISLRQVGGGHSGSQWCPKRCRVWLMRGEAVVAERSLATGVLFMRRPPRLGGHAPLHSLSYCLQ